MRSTKWRLTITSRSPRGTTTKRIVQGSISILVLLRRPCLGDLAGMLKLASL